MILRIAAAGERLASTHVHRSAAVSLYSGPVPIPLRSQVTSIDQTRLYVLLLADIPPASTSTGGPMTLGCLYVLNVRCAAFCCLE